jgi:hypothetical protein
MRSTITLHSLIRFGDMSLPFTQHFNAYLPSLADPVRIASLYDAQVFARRWAIRDKDRALKKMLRRLETANSAATIAEAISGMKVELAARGLLEKPADPVENEPLRAATGGTLHLNGGTSI